MTAEEAYDDCIAHAREGAKRQLKSANQTTDLMLAELLKSAATTLGTFADLLQKIKAIRCPQ